VAIAAVQHPSKRASSKMLFITFMVWLRNS
jgi:hypothetical protein